jgi:hypothetical protein
MLVTPKCSVRTAKPATTVANHKNVRSRVNAGCTVCSAFHHKTHNGIGISDLLLPCNCCYCIMIVIQ